MPSEFKRLTFGRFVKLNHKAVKRKGRNHWTDEQRQSNADLEDGKGITLVGYLYDAKYSVAESCNSFKHDLGWRDFHIWIVKNATHANKPESIVVEITPRIRQNKPGWKLSKLRKLILSYHWVKVRVRGYLLFDDEHWDFPMRTPPVRATAWETHPMTKFEVCPPHTTCLVDADAGWTALESYVPD